MQSETYLSHHFIIAMPNIEDEFFSKSVIYLYEHSNEGAFGLVVNKPLTVDLGAILDHLKLEHSIDRINNHPVLAGGPVSQEQGFIIHREWTDEKNIIGAPHDDLAVSASKDTLEKIAQGEGPNDFIVTLGYAAWEQDQLESEISKNDWLVVPYKPSLLFNTPLPQRWSASANSIGVDMQLMSAEVGHA